MWSYAPQDKKQSIPIVTNSGLPVCTTCERVNRYNYSFRRILTALVIYIIQK